MPLNFARLKRVIRAFEAGTLRPKDWNHRTRLLLGLWYSLNPPADGPLRAMCRGIAACESRRYGVTVRPSRTDEKITAFYLAKIQAFAIAAPPEAGLLELTEALIASDLGNPRLHRVLFEAERQPVAPVFPKFAGLGEPLDLLRAG
jgi:hypothetical protein